VLPLSPGYSLPIKIWVRNSSKRRAGNAVPPRERAEMEILYGGDRKLQCFPAPPERGQG